MAVKELCAKLRMLVNEAKLALEWLKGYAEKSFGETSQSDRLAARYNIIVLVEGLASIAFVAARLVGHEEPQGYVAALTYLARLVNAEELVPKLRSLAGLRNLPVHRYWVIDDARIHSELRQDLRFVAVVLKRLRGVLRVCWEEES